MKKFSAFLFHAALPEGKQTITLRVSAFGVEFDSRTIGAKTLPFVDLKMAKGGPDNRSLLLTDSNEPLLSVATTDLQILRELKTYGGRPISQKIAKLKFENRAANRVSFTLTLVSLVLLLLVGLYGAAAFGYLLSKIPLVIEDSTGRFITQRAVTENYILDVKVRETLREFVLPLSNVLNPEPTIMVVRGGNQVAEPVLGSRIFLSGSFVEKAESSDELYAVIAVAWAHCALRHPVQKIATLKGISSAFFVLIDMISGDVPTSYETPFRHFVSLPFTDSQLRDADDLAFRQLLAAHINPNGLIAYLERQKKVQYPGTDDGEILRSLNARVTQLQRIRDSIPISQFQPSQFQATSKRLWALKSALKGNIVNPVNKN